MDMHSVWWKIWFVRSNTVYFGSTQVTNQQYIYPQNPCLGFVSSSGFSFFFKRGILFKNTKT